MNTSSRFAATLAAPVLLSLAAAAAPATVSAQSRDGAPSDSTHSTWLMVNVVDLMLTHRSELELADSQVTRLQQIGATHDSANAPLRARLDSLRGERGAGDAGDADRSAMRERFQGMRDTFASMRDHDQAARKDAYAMLTKDQKKKAERLEDDARKSMGDDWRRSGRGGRRGMGGRGGWGGRRPGGMGGTGGMGFPPPA